MVLNKTHVRVCNVWGREAPHTHTRTKCISYAN